MKFPEHKGGLSLTHNDHKNGYQTVSECIKDYDLFDDFKDKESMERAIKEDSLWILQWYPETPIGFHRVAAPTLEECLELANIEGRYE